MRSRTVILTIEMLSGASIANLKQIARFAFCGECKLVQVQANVIRPTKKRATKKRAVKRTTKK